MIPESKHEVRNCGESEFDMVCNKKLMLLWTCKVVDLPQS